MSKTAIYGVIGILVFVIIGVLIYVLNEKINASSNSNKSKSGSASNNGQPPIIDNNDLQALADAFRTAFQAWHDIDHCTVINQALDLDNSQLKTFASLYQNSYGISVIQQMDYALVWCLNRTSGQELHDKLNAL